MMKTLARSFMLATFTRTEGCAPTQQCYTARVDLPRLRWQPESPPHRTPIPQ
ncbi:hypothetical protein [Sagittula salina]|uniref:Uncharacterized protein n=1 Tax=Sagittula salina TaxID=2820268 RepID=A0A940MME5_9RHOB|nr:hypothetical protein [Sagittula salina]MBP0481417.1 hypothetical protein [Sagittula salina]